MSAAINRPLRWGILSPARIADDVLPGLLSSTRNQPVGVASRDPQRAKSFAKRFGLDRMYASYQSLLEDPDIDCVYIPLPNSLHGEWVRQAINNGKHVLCEKPLVTTAAEAQELFALADSQGVHLAEAFMFRHHPKTHALRDLVQSGALGAIHTVRSSFNFMTEAPEDDIRFRSELGGGALRDVGSYCVSLSNLLLGEAPVEVQAASVPSPLGVAERFYGTMRYTDGAVAQFDCSMRSPLSVHVSVLGEKAEAIVAMPWYAHKAPHSIQLKVYGGDETVIAVPDANAYFLETEAFAATVRGERTPEIPGTETVRNLKTMERLAAKATPGPTIPATKG
jgi:D-xylose 1-dehydrogenase (NADP+, D-xylono-1,5-lactone-forming)